MISNLKIQNYALIESLDIDFHEGFSVITGETGAGKSILLGAIALLLGQRADTKSIRQGCSKCVIEATFTIQTPAITELLDSFDIDSEDNECIIRRELTSAGKSRAFINDTPATVAQLKALGDHLIDIHSQHQNLLLSTEDFQLQVLDTLAHNDQLLNDYRSCYHDFREASSALSKARQMVESQQEEEDYLTFQLQQLEEAQLQSGEDTELEQEQQTLEHAEEIKRGLSEAGNTLSADGMGVLELLRTSHRALQNILRVYPDAEELAERIESARIELKDIANELEDSAERIEFNPARQQFVDERLSLIYDLERKHHVETIDELITLTDELRDKLHAITHSEEHLAKLEAAMKAAEKKMLAKAAELTASRTTAARNVEQSMIESLIPLGMPNIRFEVEITPRTAPDASGMDMVTFLFNANKNAPLQPISQIASGGEIARVMLSLKALLSTAANLPTIVFDEIDTGVSGQIAERMALIMQQMSTHPSPTTTHPSPTTNHPTPTLPTPSPLLCDASHSFPHHPTPTPHHPTPNPHHPAPTTQVISITHLPQIAAMGAHHYRVYKEDTDDQTNSHITLLTPEERIEEIAHMVSGSTLTEAALSNARALLNL